MYFFWDIKKKYPLFGTKGGILTFFKLKQLVMRISQLTYKQKLFDKLFIGNTAHVFYRCKDSDFM